MPRSYDGEVRDEYIRDGEELSYYAEFNEDGKANFWTHPVSENLDIDLYVYDDRDNRLGYATTRNTDADAIVWEVNVEARREYRVRVEHSGGHNGDFQIKAKNYPSGSSHGGDDDRKIDLGIKDIEISSNHREPLPLDETIEFRVRVKNYENSTSPDYTVAVYDEDNNRLDRVSKSGLDGKDDRNVYLEVKMREGGPHRLNFKVEPEDGRDCSTDDNEKEQTFEWVIQSQDNSDGYDLEIDFIDIESNESQPFPLAQKIEFKVRVVNNQRKDCPAFSVVVYDAEGNELDRDRFSRLEANGHSNSYVKVSRDKGGMHELTFVIELEDDAEDISAENNIKTKTYEWYIDRRQVEEIYPNQNNDRYIENGRTQWFVVEFEEAGKANFYVKPENDNMTINLFIYKDNRNNEIARTNRSSGEKLISEIPVEPNIEYFIELEHDDGPSGEYMFRTVNYQQMPVTDPNGGMGSGIDYFDANDFNTTVSMQRVIEHISELESSARTFYQTEYSRKASEMEIADLVLGVLRYYTKTYIGLAWAPTTGVVNERFINYFENLSIDVANGLKLLLDKKDGKTIVVKDGVHACDFGHLIAVVDGYLSYKINPINHEWSGWGGDLATAMRDAWDEIESKHIDPNKADLNLIKVTIAKHIGASPGSFGEIDYRCDADAVRIAYHIKTNKLSLSNALRKYYIGKVKQPAEYKKRFEYLLKDLKNINQIRFIMGNVKSTTEGAMARLAPKVNVKSTLYSESCKYLYNLTLQKAKEGQF